MAEKTIELLSPAGDMERLRMSLAYGADAVYLAGPDFGMRSFAGNFTPEELRQAVELCHSRGVAVHVTCNTMPRNDEAARLPEWLEFLQAAGVDAAILADVGVLSLLKKHAPGVKAHISTQASVSNYQAAAAWYELGASRVILARELSLDEIREIRAKAPPALELEAFVHGAMCVSYSGRCLLSNYMTGRDANRGACAQPCRYQYALVEEKRPGEYFPIGEDAGGAFILNSRDMCMIDHVPELMDAGLDSLKIEGRAKSAYYAAIVTAAYRHAIDAAQAGEPLDPVWRAEVDKVSHRPYSTGFYYGEPGQHTAHARYLRDGQVVACGAFRAMEEGTAELNRVFVRPEHRRRGCARQVVEVLELQALFQGFGRMVMEIGRDIPEAISLYRKMGYREIETLTIFADNKDTLCMEKELL